ncbi:Transmembrane Fragile-X-F protein [Nesidiocoris tenuis]|uniref:Transmembrane Fragile-X-F protein n=1 Tax=Nesidiocoris tenuis TaxID=355587 RepID=A0ABN7BCW5_9HEMI|nr:Transmembrane Fragile-X-F protein [Nesidiocoris tenuis]
MGCISNKRRPSSAVLLITSPHVIIYVNKHSSCSANGIRLLVEMFFSLNELLSWLGLSLFELWLNLVSLCVFSILLALPSSSPSSWWITFSPLFVADALNAYFSTIVLIRMYLEALYKVAFFRALWSFCFLAALFSFEFLLCRKLSGETSLEYSEVISPIFILLQLMAVRACQLH